METIKSIESTIGKFVDKAPALSVDSKKKLLTRYLPLISLGLALIASVSIRSLWHDSHTNNALINYANNYGAAYGVPKVPVVNNLTFGVWLGLITLAVEAIFYLGSFSGLRAMTKSGWNFLYYALLVNIVYGVVMLFNSYGGLSTLITTLIGSALGFYFIFEIRDRYLDESKTRARKSKKS